MTIPVITDAIILAYAHALATVNCAKTPAHGIRECFATFHCECLRQAHAAANEGRLVQTENALAGRVEDEIAAEEDREINHG